MLTVVCYDIPEDRRRNRVAKVLEGFGSRVQFSVFECDLTPGQLERLKKRLTRTITGEDSLRYYHLCGQCLSKVEVVNGPAVEKAQLCFVV